MITLRMRTIQCDRDRISLSFTVLAFISSILLTVTAVWLTELGELEVIELSAIMVALLAISGAWQFPIYALGWTISFCWNTALAFVSILAPIIAQLIAILFRNILRFLIPLLLLASLIVSGWRPPFWNQAKTYAVQAHQSIYSSVLSDLRAGLSGMQSWSIGPSVYIHQTPAGEMEQTTRRMGEIWHEVSQGEVENFERLSATKIGAWADVDFSHHPILIHYDHETGDMQFSIRMLDGSSRQVSWTPRGKLTEGTMK